MKSSPSTESFEEPAPATLRSPPSTLRVRDRAMSVELTMVDCQDLATEQEEPPTRRYARVA